MVDLSFLGIPKQVPLITYRGSTWTQVDFVNAVESAVGSLANLSGVGDHFVLLDTEDPFECYPYLIALLVSGKRVVLPNKDHFTGKGDFITFAEQILTPNNGVPSISDHQGFKKLPELPGGNVVVFSSGSTGIPKGILHDFENFLMNAQDTAEELKHEAVNITFLKPYLVSALSHFLCHLFTDSHLIFADLDQLSELAAIAGRHPGMGVVGSPFHVTSALNMLPDGHRPRMFFSSGDMLPPTVIGRALERFPDTSFYYVYGLAELAGRFFINKIYKGSSTRLESVGNPIKRCEFRVEDSHLLVKSPYLYHGYIIDEDFIPSQQWHDSGDLVQESEGGLVLRGRSNDEVKVLGNKINIRYLENQVQNALQSNSIFVVPLNDERFGTLIALVIADDAHDKKSVNSRLAGVLESREMPHCYYRLDRIPFTQTMKVDRKTIANQIKALQRL